MPARHFFFDLDNTLTRSKSHIAPEHTSILKKLISLADVIVVSGHAEKDIKAHLEGVSGFYTMGQNGNVAKRPDGTIIWERKLSPDQVEAIHRFIAKARTHLAYKVENENDIIEDRGAQIAFSLIGHHLNQDIKDAFDPDHAKRKKLLEDLVADVAELRDKIGWKKEDCIYIGDALFPGGNDETVIGIIPTHAVKDYRETYTYLSSILI